MRRILQGDFEYLPHYCSCPCHELIILNKKYFMFYEKNGYPKFIKGHNRNGTHHSKESIKRMIEIQRIIHDTTEFRKKQSESHIGLQSGKDHPMYGKHHTAEVIEKLKQINTKEKHPQYGKRGIQSHNFGRVGKSSGRYGKVGTHSKKIYEHITPFQGIKKMHRSEKIFAEYLDLIEEPYYYEPIYYEMNINGKDTTYTPDFYLPKWYEFIEIKGYWRDDALIKSIEFEQNLPYPFKYTVIMFNELKTLGIDIDKYKDNMYIKYGNLKT